MKRTYAAELERMRRSSPEDARALKALGPWLDRDEKRPRLGAQAAGRNVAEIACPQQMVRCGASSPRCTLGGHARALVGQLQDWCQRAEASGIAPLAELSRRVRSYA